MATGAINNVMSEQFSNYMRELGAILIAIGVVSLIVGVYSGLGYIIYSMISLQEYVYALLTFSTSTIITGAFLKAIFKKR